MKCGGMGRTATLVATAIALTAACTMTRKRSPADLALEETLWRQAMDSSTRALCADSVAHGARRCTTTQRGDTLFIWADSARHPAGFIKIHNVSAATRDSEAAALEMQITTKLGAGVRCTEQIRGWRAGSTTAMVVRRPAAVLLVLGNREQSEMICPGLGTE